MSSDSIKIIRLYEPLFAENSESNEVFNHKYNIVDLLGGRGRGGSHFMAQHALISLFTAKYFRAFFMRAIHKDIKTSLWKGFMDRFNEFCESGIINESDFHILDREMYIKHIPSKNEIRSKGFKTSSGGLTANLKSLEGATNIYIEEAEETTQEQHEKLSDSLRTTKGNLLIMRSWNIPEKNHYLVKNWYDTEPIILIDGNGKEHDGYVKLIPKNIDKHLMIFGTYKDNEENIEKDKRKEYENYKYTNPDHYFTDILGYSSGGAKGVVFKFNIDWFIYDELPNIEFYTLYGLDFGGGSVQTNEADGNSKTVLAELKINKTQMSIYVKILIYRGYIETNELCSYLDWHVKGDEILADNARQDKITELTNKGYYVIPAKSQVGKSGEVMAGYDILRQYTLYINKNDEHAQTELKNHKYVKRTDGMSPNKVEDKYKDVLDSIRYAVTYYHLTYNI